ncbi:MAG: hypothetical protein IT370_34575 [Deltaproteobacteria bacterium]|nr:hypothetical protein [Deltaproteobacteria bacterium]
MQRWRMALGLLGLIGLGAAGCGSRRRAVPPGDAAVDGAGTLTPPQLAWVRVAQGALINRSPAGDLVQRSAAAGLTGVLARHARVLVVRAAPGVITVTPIIEHLEELASDAGGMVVQTELALELTRDGVLLDRLATTTRVDLGRDPSAVERAHGALTVIDSSVLTLEAPLVRLLERLAAPPDAGP